MATNTSGGTTASLSNTPQAKADTFYRNEDLSGITMLDVMLNDLGGNAKILWSVDDSATDAAGATDLIATDVGKIESTASDTSANGAKIWIQDGQVAYQSNSLSAAFKAALQALAVGQTITDTFTYAIRLSNGTLSWNTATIVFTGANDGPVANADSNGADLVAEAGVNPGNTQDDGDQSATGNLLANDTDVDNGAVLTVKDVNGSAANLGAAVEGTYGTVTINADGSWTYALNNDDGDTQQLAQGETATETFSYTVTDQHGATSTSTLTITITGTNDGPVANSDGGTTSENSVVTIDVLANDTDVDNNHELTVTAASAPAGQGTASVVGNQVQFDPGIDFDYLAEGDSVTVTVSYMIEDEHGASSNSTIDILVTGTNDTPVANADSGSVAEDADTFGNVGANDTDADAGAILSYGLNDPDSAPVGLVFNTDGSWTFDASGYDSLNQGQELVLEVPYAVTDQHGASSSANLTITVTGTNDTPVANADSGSVAEDADTSGNVGSNDTDADAGAILSYALNSPGTAPVGLVFNPDGSWTFDASSYDSLNQDQELVLEVPYTVTDQHGASSSANLTITVTGTNDTPVATADSGSVAEDAGTFGNVGSNDTDADAGAILSYALNDPDSGPVGLVFNTDGSWTFDASSYDGLNQGQELVLEVPYTVTDQHGASSSVNLTITVTGTNDAPVANADSGSVAEDADTLGNVGANDTDADAGAILSYALNDAGSAPIGLEFNTDGSWTFDASSYDSLSQGQELVLEVPYTVTDQHGGSSSASLTITVIGTNDAAILSSANVTLSETNAVLSTGGTLSIDDVDSPETFMPQEDVAGSHGTFSIDAAGNWTYVANSPFDELNTPDSLTDTFVVASADGTTTSVSVTIKGTNDNPVLTGTQAVLPGGTEDINYTIYEADLLAGFTDVDGGDLRVSSLTAVNGILTDNLDGTWTFDPVTNFNGTVTLNYSVVDGHGGLVSATNSFTLAPVNDPANFAGNDVGEVTEDAAPNPINGQLFAVDPDGPSESAFQPQVSTAGTYGSFSIGASGAWTYTLNNADSDTDALAAGQPVTDVFTVASIDGTTSVVTINITGANDTPSALPVTGEADEDGPSIAVAADFTDVDAGDSHTFSVNTTGTLGTVTDHGDGTFSYDPNGQFESLAEGETATDTFSYTVTDSFGQSSTETVTITVNGQNDAPDAIDDIASIDEDNSVLIDVRANDDDPDDSDVLLITAASIVSGLGTVTIESGQLRYNPGASYNGLGAGQTATVVLSYTVDDGHGGTDTASVTVTVTGAADGVVPPPTETGADPNDFDTLVGTNAPNNSTTIVGSNALGDNLTGGNADQDINGRGGNDSIYGAAGNDDIDGGADNDLLYGQAGDDDINGNNGLDSVFGGSGDDELIGGNEADTLYGGSDNDAIVGNNGNDIIIGGYGQDTLTGGGDNDTFRYLSILDTNDTIVDFMGSGNDQIDLSAIDATPGGLDDPFAWGGTTATEHGVWFSYDAGSNTTTLYADTDGNEGTAELMLTLQNYSGLNPFSNPLTPPADITL